MSLEVDGTKGLECSDGGTRSKWFDLYGANDLDEGSTRGRGAADGTSLQESLFLPSLSCLVQY